MDNYTPFQILIMILSAFTFIQVGFVLILLYAPYLFFLFPIVTLAVIIGGTILLCKPPRK